MTARVLDRAAQHVLVAALIGDRDGVDPFRLHVAVEAGRQDAAAESRARRAAAELAGRRAHVEGEQALRAQELLDRLERHVAIEAGDDGGLRALAEGRHVENVPHAHPAEETGADEATLGWIADAREGDGLDDVLEARAQGGTESESPLSTIPPILRR